MQAIATKVFNNSHGYESTKKAVEESLQKLAVRMCLYPSGQIQTVLPSASTEYIDLFLIHSPKSGKEKRLETYKALLEARDAGKIRTVGVSS